jgi:ADP-ribose pyrophosphatase YjhB (NUDIX family)
MRKYKVCCVNCGKSGHISKACHFPKNSYGCVIFKKTVNAAVRYLLIQRKYTPEYIDIIRGKYYDSSGSILNYQYLVMLIKNLSLIERNYIIQYDFDYLWKNIWKWIGTQNIQKDYDECERKFNLLKNDKVLGHTFASLFEQYPTTMAEPDWELPKGKRKLGETDKECAIREFCEETMLESTDFSIYVHVKPFQEKFMGDNIVEYCNNYYVGKLTNTTKPIYYDPKHTEQNKEIRKIGWFTETEMSPIINPKCQYRLKMIHDINILVSHLP